MHLAHAGKMGEYFGAAIELQIVCRTIALMTAHDGCKGRQVNPTVHQFCGPDHAMQAGISAEVAVVVSVAQ